MSDKSSPTTQTCGLDADPVYVLTCESIHRAAKLTANNPLDQPLAEAFNAVLERQKDAPLFLHPEMGRTFEKMGLLKPGDWTASEKHS